MKLHARMGVQTSIDGSLEDLSVSLIYDSRTTQMPDKPLVRVKKVRCASALNEPYC